ncbi:MAG: hypothetical protein F4087_14125 [Gemmatimonadetes bacterium]|nr:Ig-like domain-containing protein [Gemmatimonadota bacterium]MDE2676448.1 Ig-like domain-containing protein [Gemmatimonadota bacterium]MYA11006.1 hypothetical protein [Gemmatimonadota bacterium]MYE71636.1 hypothetical protein [Gemmatimonadota bacterium]MYJ69626.1 hypothetical protein [Gemmatimonadota bacterium]
MTSSKPKTGLPFLSPGLICAAILPAAFLSGCRGDAGPTGFTGYPSVTVEPYSTRLTFIGQTRSFRATVRGPLGERIAARVSWSSSDPSVFTVDGTGTVTAVADGVAALTASAEGATGTASVTVERRPAIVQVLSGGDQEGIRGRALSERIVVRVTDEGGAGLSGISVNFTPDAGNGSAGPASARTDGNGDASTVWTLADRLGTQALVVSAGGDVVNGVRARALPETPIPDVLIAGGLRPPAHDPTNLETFEVALRIANAGNAPTPPATTLAFVVDGVHAGAIEIDRLDAGDSVEVTHTLGPLEEGDREIAAILDPGGEIQEWFEDNNDASASLTVRQQTVLAVGDSLTLPSAMAGEVMLFRVDIAEPAQGALAVRLAGGEGDGDLFVDFGKRPAHFHDYECLSGNPDTSELCHMMPTRAGSYHVAVHAARAFGPSALTVTAGEEVEPFDIDLVFLNRLTASQERIIREAANRWESVIARGAADVDFSANAVPRGSCFAGSPSIDTGVDDLMILITVRNVDGEGGTVIQSGPCIWRSVQFTGTRIIRQEVAVGSMALDREDVRALEADGLLRAVLEHHIAHVLGFGFDRSWRLRGLFGSAAVEGSPPDQYFTGPLATAAFDAAGGVRYAGGGGVPVENVGPGTGEHWRGSVFGDELMTNVLKDGSPPLSLITIESLADLGYGVDLTRADEYTLPGAGAPRMAAPTRTGPVFHFGDDLLRNPVLVVDRQGRVVRIHGPPRDPGP